MTDSDRHAYLIMTPGNLPMLSFLLSVIDDERNDIYVHIDKKAAFDGSSLHTSFSRLYVLDRRIDARWGDYSLVEIEFNLFEESYKNGPYAYYHLLSGEDCPIKSQDYIHGMCTIYSGTQFVGFSQISSEDLKWRYGHRFLFSRYFRSSSFLITAMRGLAVRVQDIVAPKKMNIDVRKGSQWCSVTNDFVGYLLSKRATVHLLFYKTFAPDEMFIQTLVWNSIFRNRVYDAAEGAAGNMRFISWKNCEPEKITVQMLPEFAISVHWFARKCVDESVARIIWEGLNDN